MTFEQANTAQHRFDVTVKSIPIEVDFDSSLTSHWDSSAEFFTNQYFGAGGSSVCLNSDSEQEDFSMFDGLETYLQSETLTIETDTDGTEILTTTGTPEQGWSFTYVVVCSFTVNVLDDELDSAKAKLYDFAQKNLMIYDVGADDVLEIEEIKIESL
jgi:hypothetical protein